MGKSGGSDRSSDQKAKAADLNAPSEPKRQRVGKVLSDADLEIWRRVVASVQRTDKPAVQEPDIERAKSKPVIPQRTTQPEAPSKTAPVKSYRSSAGTRDSVTPLSDATPGLDRNTARKLRRGKIAPDGRLDLHGMTAARAHQALIGFVQQHYGGGARCLLIITGKGGRPKEPEPGQWRVADPGAGVLKTQTPLWLSQPPLSGLVTGIYPAHISHGGGGALYVYLRKNPVRRDRS